MSKLKSKPRKDFGEKLDMKSNITKITSVNCCHMLSTRRKTKRMFWGMSSYKPHTGWTKESRFRIWYGAGRTIASLGQIEMWFKRKDIAIWTRDGNI